MVQFPQFRFLTLFIQMRITGSRLLGYPIRQPADQWMFAPPRRFSQLAAAFLASIRQGIRRKPFSRLTILLFPLELLSSNARSPPRNSLRFKLLFETLPCFIKFPVPELLSYGSYLSNNVLLYGPG